MSEHPDQVVLRSKRDLKARWIFGIASVCGLIMAMFCLVIIVACWFVPDFSFAVSIGVTIWVGLTAALMLFVPLNRFNQLLTRYIITPDGLTAAAYVGKQFMPWNEVIDYSVESGGAGKPLTEIKFHSTDGTTMRLPLDLEPEGQLERLLPQHLPLVAEHGLDRPRNAEIQAPILRKITFKKAAGGLVGTGFCLVIAAGCAMASYNSLQEYLDYRQIIQNPVEATATIIELDVDEDSAYLTFEFTDSNGQTIQSYRQVDAKLAKTFSVGDRVSIQHLQGAPGKARLLNGDQDFSAWRSLLLLIPFGWLSICAAWGWLTPVILSKKVRGSWSVNRNGGRALVTYSPVSLETNRALCPELHLAGAGVFSQLNDKGERHDYIDRLKAFSIGSDELKENGIDSEFLAESYLCLGPDAMSLMVAGLDESTNSRAEYVVIEQPNATAAGEWALRNNMLHSDTVALAQSEHVHFVCKNRTVGPIPVDDLPKVFDRYIVQQIKAICEGQNVEGLEAISCCELLELPADGLNAKILLRLAGNRLRVYVRCRGESSARVAEFQMGLWRRLPDVPRLLAMKDPKWFKRVMLLPLGWMLLLPAVAICLSWAFEWPMRLYRNHKHKVARMALCKPSGRTS